MNHEEIKLATEPYINKLAAMQTAQEIREFLAAEGIKAVPQNEDKCALAAYIQRDSGCPVVVGGAGKICDPSWIYSSSRGYKRVIVAVGTPAMQEFVYNFDNHHYPELVQG